MRHAGEVGSFSDRVATSSILFAIAVVASACGGASAAMGPGVAVVKVANWEWHIDGSCEQVGDDMTFTGLGDPMLSIGFKTTGAPTAVGNLSSVSKGFVSFIGHPDVANPTVTIAGKSYSVSGAFFVEEGVQFGGDILVTCE